MWTWPQRINHSKYLYGECPFHSWARSDYHCKKGTLKWPELVSLISYLSEYTAHTSLLIQEMYRHRDSFTAEEKDIFRSMSYGRSLTNCRITNLDAELMHIFLFQEDERHSEAT